MIVFLQRAIIYMPENSTEINFNVTRNLFVAEHTIHPKSINNANSEN